MSELELYHIAVIFVMAFVILAGILLLKSTAAKPEFKEFRIIAGMTPVEEIQVTLDGSPVRTIDMDPGINWGLKLYGPLDTSARLSVEESMEGEYYQLVLSSYGGEPLILLRYAHGELKQIAVPNVPSGVELRSCPY